MPRDAILCVENAVGKFGAKQAQLRRALNCKGCGGGYIGQQWQRFRRISQSPALICSFTEYSCFDLFEEALIERNSRATLFSRSCCTEKKSIKLGEVQAGSYWLVLGTAPVLDTQVRLIV